jgi:hypothetical protein
MAEQYTPEEIQEIFQAYNDAVARNVPISKELAQQMQDAQKGIKNWTNEVNASWKKLGTSATDLGKSLYKGEKGAGQFGGALETATDALSMMILLIPGVGIAAKAAALAIKTFGKAVNVAGKQGEALHKSYKELSQVGAATAGGLQDVFVNAQKLGYGIEDLDKMVALVAANSETLAKFSLTAGDGASAFADALNDLVRDPSLRMLGKMPDDINAAGASFVKQITRSGIGQAQIGDQLSSQTKRYILDLDRLQRLTGTSADALERQQEEAMAEDAYNQVMSELRSRALAGDNVAQEQINKITTVMAKMGPELRKEFILGVGGDVSAMQRLFMSAPSLLKNTMDETVSLQKTLSDAGQDVDKTVKTIGPLAKLAAGSVRESFGPLVELREFGLATRDIDARVKAAEESARVTDAGVKNLTQLDLAQMRSREALQSFVQLGVNPATNALSKLAGAAAGVTGVLPGKTARGAPPSVPPGGGTAPNVASGDYANKVIQAESGGRNIANQSGPGGAATSSAFGIAQITKGTFEDLARKAGPGNPLYNKTFEDMKGDINLQKQALGQLTDKNRIFLANAGLSTSDAALYLAHFLGPGGAKRALSQPDNAPIQNAVDFGQYMANPMLQKMSTVGDLKAWADKKMGGGGYRDGGIATGPSSGYQATLHGTEAIVPLPDGKKIPVDMPGFTSSMADQSSILTQQLSKLDDLVRVMQRQVEVSSKILQMTS